MKEKILDVLVQTGWDKKLNDIQQIADDYAIEFALWVDGKYYQGEVINEYHKSINEYRDGKYFTAKELLEIFKKEKRL